jgi:hypothetical protein
MKPQTEFPIKISNCQNLCLNVSGHPITQGLQFWQTSLRITSSLIINHHPQQNPFLNINLMERKREETLNYQSAPYNDPQVLTHFRSAGRQSCQSQQHGSSGPPVITEYVLPEGSNSGFLDLGVETAGPGQCGGSVSCVEEEDCEGDVHLLQWSAKGVDDGYLCV